MTDDVIDFARRRLQFRSGDAPPVCWKRDRSDCLVRRESGGRAVFAWNSLFNLPAVVQLRLIERAAYAARRRTERALRLYQKYFAMLPIGEYPVDGRGVIVVEADGSTEAKSWTMSSAPLGPQPPLRPPLPEIPVPIAAVEMSAWWTRLGKRNGLKHALERMLIASLEQVLADRMFGDIFGRRDRGLLSLASLANVTLNGRRYLVRKRDLAIEILAFPHDPIFEANLDDQIP